MALTRLFTITAMTTGSGAQPWYKPYAAIKHAVTSPPVSLGPQGYIKAGRGGRVQGPLVDDPRRC